MATENNTVKETIRNSAEVKSEMKLVEVASNSARS